MTLEAMGLKACGRPALVALEPSRNDRNATGEWVSACLWMRPRVARQLADDVRRRQQQECTVYRVGRLHGTGGWIVISPDWSREEMCPVKVGLFAPESEADDLASAIDAAAAKAERLDEEAAAKTAA